MGRFIEQLRATAAELKPLTESASSGDLVWNGTEYSKTGESKTPNPYALCWWAVLGTIADLLEAQQSPLSEKQIRYLERRLFGGMGSLNDLFFDTSSAGDNARSINDRLDERRRALFASFKDA